MGSYAHGSLKLPCNASTLSNYGSVGLDQLYMPCLSGQHHHLVAISGRTQKECCPCPQGIERCTPLLLIKEINPFHHQTELLGTPYLNEELRQIAPK